MKNYLSNIYHSLIDSFSGSKNLETNVTSKIESNNQTELDIGRLIIEYKKDRNFARTKYYEMLSKRLE